MSPLVHPAALFRFRFPCRRLARLAAFDERQAAACRLPDLAGVVGVPDVSTLAIGWHPHGLVVRASMRGVGSVRWCHATRPEDSDGLHLWIATRSTGESHRTGRFCRRLAILPSGGGPQAKGPLALAVSIPRSVAAVELPESLPQQLPAVLPETMASVTPRVDPDGWTVDAVVTSEILPGWDPAEQPVVGFFAAVVDRRLGRVPLLAPPEYPWESDPTTWSSLELTG